jgi:hypothetical protein
MAQNSSSNIGDVHDLLMERAPSPARMAYTSEKHPRSTFSELNLIRKHHELSDVILTVGNRKIFAHKVILAACSPYFRAMFTGELIYNLTYEQSFIRTSFQGSIVHFDRFKLVIHNFSPKMVF